MPYLMVNLDDKEDCRKALKQLRNTVWQDGDDPNASSNCDKRGRNRKGRHRDEASRQAELAALPLPQKLQRIKQRQIWKHLVRIAQAGDQPQSLTELDETLDLPKNKMRSLKAIMAKLENRFSLKFLRVAEDAGVDASGNPRYEMPKNVRRQILKVNASSND